MSTGRGQRRLRARRGDDSAGDTYFPGWDYIFNWIRTWPSASGNDVRAPRVLSSRVSADGSQVVVKFNEFLDDNYPSSPVEWEVTPSSGEEEDTVAPILVFARVSADGSSLVLTYDEPLNDEFPGAPSDWTVTVL